MITSRGNHSTTYTGKIESAYRDIICKTVEVYKADCPLDLTDKASCIMRSFSAFAASNPGCYSITAAPRYGKVRQHFTLPVGRSAHICIMYDHNLGTSLQQLLVSTPGAVTEALVRASAELMLELVQVQRNPDLPLCITEHKFNTGKLFVDAAEVAGSNGSQSRTAGVGIACSSSGGCGSRMRFAGYSGCRIQQRGAPLQPACDTTAAAAGASTGLPATGQHIFPASSMPDIEQIPHVLVELAVAGCLSTQEPSSNGQRRSSGSSMQHTPQQQTQQAHAQQDPATVADLQLFLMGGPFSDALQERMAGCFAAGWTSGKLLEVRGFIVDCLAAATAGTGSAAQHLTAWALLQHPWLGGSSEQWATAQAVAAAGVQQEHGEPDLEDNSMDWAAARAPLPAPLAESVTKNDQNMGQGVGWHQSAGGTVLARTETACAAVAVAVGGSQKDKENKSPGVRDDSGKRPAGQAAAAAGDGQEGDENRGELKGILKKQPGPGKSPETKRRRVVTFRLPPPPEKKQQP
jgi:hypothetical protein